MEIGWLWCISILFGVFPSKLSLKKQFKQGGISLPCCSMKWQLQMWLDRMKMTNPPPPPNKQKKCRLLCLTCSSTSIRPIVSANLLFMLFFNVHGSKSTRSSTSIWLPFYAAFVSVDDHSVFFNAPASHYMWHSFFSQHPKGFDTVPRMMIARLIIVPFDKFQDFNGCITIQYQYILNWLLILINTIFFYVVI